GAGDEPGHPGAGVRGGLLVARPGGTQRGRGRGRPSLPRYRGLPHLPATPCERGGRGPVRLACVRPADPGGVRPLVRVRVPGRGVGSVPPVYDGPPGKLQPALGLAPGGGLGYPESRLVPEWTPRLAPTHPTLLCRRPHLIQPQIADLGFGAVAAEVEL